MKKNNLNLFFYLPFLLSFTFLLKIPLFDSASINVLDILLTTAIFAGLLIIKENKLSVDFWDYWTDKNLYITLLLLLFILGVTTSLSFNAIDSDLIRSFGLIKSFLVLPIIFALFLVFFIQKKYLKLSTILNYFFISIGIISILGILAIFTNNLTFDGRLSFFYDSPNHFAMMLSPAIIIGVWMLFFKKSFTRKTKCFLLFLLFFLFVNLFFTKSLGAIIALLISLSFLFLIKIKIPTILNITKIFTLLIILISFSLLLNTSFLTDRLNYKPLTPPSSNDSRIAIYTSGEKIAKENFLWGIGIGNFQKTYLDYQEYFTPYPQWAVPHAHNNFFHTYIELGIISTMTLFTLLMLKLYKKQKKPEKILALSILIYILFHGIIDTTIWHNDTSLLFWFFLLTI